MGPLRLVGWLKFFNDYVIVLEIFLNKLILPTGPVSLRAIKPIDSLPQITPSLEENGHYYGIKNVQVDLFLSYSHCTHPALGNKELFSLGKGLSMM